MADPGKGSPGHAGSNQIELMLSVVPRLLEASVLRLEPPHLVLQDAERAQLAPILVRSFSHSTSMARLDASWKYGATFAAVQLIHRSRHAMLVFT